MTQLPFGFRFSAITDEEFATDVAQYRPDQQAGINLRFAMDVDTGERLLMTRVSVQFFEMDTANEPLAPFLQGSITCHFVIAPESWAEWTDEAAQTLTIPRPVNAHFQAFTVGTLRGFLHAKLERNVIQVLLPPINVTQAVAQDGDVVVSLVPENASE